MTTETKSRSSVAVVAFAAFAVLLIAIFLVNRGGDVGKLPQLAGNLGGGPLTGDGSISVLVGLLSAYCIAMSWAGLGEAALRFIPDLGEVDRSLTLSIRMAVGAAAWSLVWFILGLVGLYNSVTAFVSLAVGLLLFFVLRAWRAQVTKPASTLSFVLLGLCAIVLLLSLFSAIAPPIAKDTLLYHFALPKAFIAQHSNAFVDGNIASYLALGTEMHYVWAMLVGNVLSSRAGEIAAGATGFLFFPILLTAVTRWATDLGLSRTWALIATLMVATIPTAYHVASSGYVDLSLALYLTLATYSLTRWWKEQTWGWVILIGILLGAALSVKLTAVFVFAAFALAILLRGRGGGDMQAGSLRSGRVVASGLAALLLAGVIASPWYIRTWTETGSPTFPFYMSILPAEAPGWDVERSNLFQASTSRYGGLDKTPLNYLLAPWNLSVAAQPERPEYFDGVLGIAFLFGLPILIWALWRFDLSVAAKIASGVAAVMFLFWLFSSQQLRYLLPIMPLLAVAIAAAAEKVAVDTKLRQVLRYGFVLAGVAGILVIAAWFLRTAPVRFVLGGETRNDYLARSLDYYPYYMWINSETETDAKVWLINMRRDTYHIDRPVFSDYFFEDWTLRHMVWESRTAQELRDKTAERGIKYVLTRHDFLFDYDRTTLVDDKKPRVENEAKLRIAREFILDPANTIRSDSKFSLVKVF